MSWTGISFRVAAIFLTELLQGDEHKPLIDYEHKMGRQAILVVPTPDHYLPLL
jgi:hypothetical protein